MANLAKRNDFARKFMRFLTTKTQRKKQKEKTWCPRVLVVNFVPFENKTAAGPFYPAAVKFVFLCVLRVLSGED